MYKFDAENRFQYHDFEPIVLQDKVQECEKRAAHYGRAYFGHNCHLLIEVNAIMSGEFAKRIPTDYRLNLLELQKVNDKENYILSESAYLFWFAKKGPSMVPPDDFAGAYCRYDGRRRSWWLERIDLVQNALLHARFDEYNIEWRELMDSFRMLTINPFSPEYLEYKKELASITPKTITDAATEILEFTLNQIEKEK